MGVVAAFDLASCAGQPPASSGAACPSEQPAVSDDEAVAGAFIPAEGLSAALVSARRVLVTGGVLDDERVLPFTVIRYFDADASARRAHAWTRPIRLRPAPRAGRRRRPDAAFPVPRMEHTLTLVPDDARLYLVGGMKVGVADGGSVCRTLFAFDTKKSLWDRVDVDRPPARVKPDPDQQLGPRFAHVAVHVARRPSPAARSRAKPAPFIYVHGGYQSHDDRTPRRDMHAFDVKNSRWSLVVPAHNGVPAPSRAYHAACVTPSHRYVVLHGGNNSDDDDPFSMSDKLFVFDVLTAHWIEPNLHPASHPPPTARRRHSLVNGVGRHHGLLVLYGGYLREGFFSNEMFTCRLIEPNNAGTQLIVVWEKIDVKSALHGPLPHDSHRLSEKKQSIRRTVAGGCLVAIPKIAKYVLIGGRGEHGMRSSPLLLDPFESDEIAISQSLPPAPDDDDDDDDPANHHDVDDNGLLSLRKDSHKYRQPAPDERHAQSAPHKQDAASEHTPVRKTKTRSSKRARSVERPRANPTSALPTPDIETSMDAPQPSSIHATPTERPRSQVPSDNPAHLATSDTNGKAPDSPLKPATNVNGPSAMALRQLRRDGEVEVPGVQSERLGHAVAKQRTADQEQPAFEIGTEDMDFITPPSKRRRFKDGANDDPKALLIGQVGLDSQESPPGLEKDANELTLSNRSEFVSKAELLFKGNASNPTAARGRGRSRGRGRGRGRGGAAAEAHAQNEREEEERVSRENAERVGHLEAENASLKLENERVNTDNQELNEQMKDLLEEVKVLRTQVGSQGRPASDANRSRKANGSHHDSSLESMDNDSMSGRLTSKALERKVGSKGLQAVVAQSAQLQRECAEVTKEKESLAAAMKDLENGKRAVENELNMTKNDFDKVAISRDSFRKQVDALQRELSTEGKAKESAEKRARLAEEEKAVLTIQCENLKQQVRAEQRQRVEEELELSNAGRMVKTVQGQLEEANRKYDDYGIRERQLRAEAAAARRKGDELLKELDVATTAKQKAEDKIIELRAEGEQLRRDLEKQLKQADVALQEAERSREALERERKHSSDATSCQKHLERELERTKRENEQLKGVSQRWKDSLSTLMPMVDHVSNGIHDLMEKQAQEDEVEQVRSQALQTGEGDMNGLRQDSRKDSNRDEAHKRLEGDAVGNGSGVEGGDVPRGKATETNATTAAAGVALTGKVGAGKRQDVDMAGTIPDSDEADEP